MADYNRNQRGSYRSSHQDWNEDRGRQGRNEDDDRNYNFGENRGHENSNREFNEGGSGWQSRYQREDFNRGTGGEGYNSGNFNRQYERNYNAGNYDSDQNYGYGSYSGYNPGNSGNYNRERNLYDRDYQGSNRSSYSNSGSRLGGANYGSYGDTNRGNEGRNFGGYSGSNYGGNYYGGSTGNREREDRNWWDRASDEVSSWFGDDEAERRRARDKQIQGQHKGKGPKNYSRSDERIKDDINDRLSDDPFIDASEIDVTVNSGEVTLTGTVDHRNTKRRAEDLAEAVSGVKHVENRIRVGQSQSSFSGGSGSSTQGTLSQSETTTSQSTSGVAGSERTRNKVM